MFSKAKAMSKKRSWQRGQGLVEYALLLVLVAIVTIGGVGLLGSQIRDQFCTIVAELGDYAPSVDACPAVRVQCVKISKPSGIQVQAIVNGYNGPAGTQSEGIQNVKFYLDGSSSAAVTETQQDYCLGGSDDCSSSSYSASGTHTVRVVATNTDGETGECTVTVTGS